MGGQLSYQLRMDVAHPGMPADENQDSRVVSYPAGENIEFGRLVEVDQTLGQVFKVSGTSNLLNATGRKTVGVTVYDPAREQQLASAGGSAGSGFYQSGEMVPVMRKGRIYAAWDGSGNQGAMSAINVNHPGATDPNDLRGVFTGSAVTVVASAEVAAAPAEIVNVKDTSKLTPRQTSDSNIYVALIELNLPGA